MAIERDVTYVIRVRDEASRQFARIANSVQLNSAQLRSAGLAFTGIGAAGSAAIAKLATEASNLEQLNISFETMLGNADLARRKIDELQKFATRTPFTLPGVENAARSLLAVGFNAEELLPTLKAVGDVSAGLGRGEEGLQRLILNLGQVRAQGKLTGRELRDFAVLGVPLIDELAKTLGVAKEEITELTSQGEITDEIVTQAFANMTSEGGRFGNLMAKQNQTLLGQWSNLQDSLVLLARTIGEPLLGPLNEVIQKVIVFAEAVGQFVQNNPEIAKFGALVLLMGTAFSLLVGPLLLVAGTLGALGIALLPAGAIVVGITGLIALVAALITHWEGLKFMISEFVSGAAQMIVNVVEQWKAAFELAKITIVGIIDGIKQKFENFVNAALQKIQALIARIQALASRLTFGAIPAPQERATGGFTSSPVALVGEQGPELVRLPRGSFVNNARDTERLLSSREGRSVEQNVEINLGGVTVMNEADEDRLIAKLQRMIELQSLSAA